MTDIVTTASKAVTNAANNTFKMVANVTNSTKSSMNSLLPLGVSKNITNSGSTGGDLYGTLFLYGGLVIFFFGVLYFFNKQLGEGLDFMIRSIRNLLGITTQPASFPDPPGQNNQPNPPQNNTPTAQQAIIEKILPVGSKEVYNVSSNTFSFYDAEPLCRALGAELATYDQVKESWNRGADWCNYGWVKGQMAVYPTQQSTYDKTQNGTPEQAGACGTVGINGGYFDNPGLQYGVNCYGPKPAQTSHDEKMLMEDGKIPTSPSQLLYDQQVQKFKKEAPSLFIKPFNDDRWFTR